MVKKAAKSKAAAPKRTGRRAEIDRAGIVEAHRREHTAERRAVSQKKVEQELPKFERMVKNLRAYGATQSELSRIVVAAYHA